jgi:hypothetical protein
VATVYISGCSNSHFHYLDSHKDSWTSQLDFSKVYNHAICGSSNDFITRRAIDFCSRHKPELVIIQWTQLPRWETIGAPGKFYEEFSDFYSEDHTYPEYNYLNVKTEKEVKPYKWFEHFKPDFYASVPYGNWLTDAKDKAFVTLEDATTSLFSLIKNAYILQSYFKENNQSYLFVNGGDWLHSQHFNYPGDFGSWYPLDFIESVTDGPVTAIQPLASKIDKTFWPNINIMEDIVDRGSDGEHPGKQSNLNFAKLVKEKIDVGNR